MVGDSSSLSASFSGASSCGGTAVAEAVAKRRERGEGREGVKGRFFQFTLTRKLMYFCDYFILALYISHYSEGFSLRLIVRPSSSSSQQKSAQMATSSYSKKLVILIDFYSRGRPVY